MKRLDPKSVWLFFLQYSIGWIIFVVFFGSCFIFPVFIGIFEDSRGSINLFGSATVMLLLGFIFVSIVVIILSYITAKLTYSNYKYELKEDGFYKESGIITKKYVTIPYERIQNVDINRGLLSRLLGLSDLQIQTAGMSAVYGKYGAYGAGAEGRLPAIAEADAVQIRDELVRRAKGKKETGGL